MSNIIGMAETFLRMAVKDPAVIMPVLAYACVVTIIIAIVSDALLRKRELAQQRKPAENPSSSPGAKNRPHSSDR